MANNNPVRSGGKNRAQEMMSRSLGGSPESSASVQKSQVSSLEKNFGSNSSVRGNMTGAKTPQIFRDSISRQQLETKTANDDKPKNNVTKAQLDGREFNNDQMGTQSGVRNVAQQSNSQQTNKTRPSDDGDKVLQQQDQSGIYISRNAPKTQRGGKLVDDDPAGLKGGAENNVSREFSKLLSGPGLIGDKKNEDKEEEKNAEIQEVVQTSEIQMENEAVQEENMLGAAAALMAANDNQEEKDQEVLKKIVSEMKKHGINIDPKEAEALLTSNFKVKFPWIMLGVTFFKWMQEIYFFLIGIMISFLGDLPSNLIGLIPGLGTLISFLMKMSVSVLFYVVGLALDTRTGGNV
jgi:hypothetical protein